MQVRPANPFDPEAAFVPDVLRRLFEAIDDVQREYHGQSRQAKESLREAVREAGNALDEIYGDEPLDMEDVGTLVVEEVAL